MSSSVVARPDTNHARPGSVARMAVLLVIVSLFAALLPPSEASAQTPPYNRGINRACSSEARGFDPFRDVSSGTHVPAINCIAFFGVSQGRLASNGTYVFDSLTPVTREQMASFIARTMNRVDGFQLSSGSAGAFPDSTGEHRRNIDRLAGAGIVEGRANGRFDRRSSVTREQMASFVTRAIEHITGEELRSTDVFRNAGVSSAHDDNVAKLAAIGVVQGRSGGSFGPQMPITRQEMASFLARGLDYLAGSGYGLTPETPSFRQVLGSFTTPLVPGQRRNHNIHLGADIIDGQVIQPGQRYSLNQGIGQRTRARGFVGNGAISGGEFVSAVGGGVSQLATTFFNASWFAGIELVSHRPHSQYLSRYPPGREATISWGSIDLVVRNDTPSPITIRTSYSNSSVTIELVGTPWATNVETRYSGPSNPPSGAAFTASYSRTVTYPNGSRSTDSFRHTYRAS